MFCRSECKCDEAFRDCLGTYGEKFVKLIIELTFFHVLPRTCFNLVPGDKPGTMKGEVQRTSPFEEIIDEVLDEIDAVIPDDDAILESIDDTWGEIGVLFV